MKIYEWEEYNCNEGEIWSFFIKLSDEQYVHLINLISEEEDYNLYQTDKSDYENEIECFDDNCYMPRYTDLTEFEYPDVIHVVDVDEFYKGGFWLK